MNYEQKYKEALEKLQEALAPCEDGCKISGLTRDYLENIFPELKESEDERIREGLIKAFRTIGKKDWGELIVRDILAWLEKQGEQTQLDYEHADIPQKDFAPIENKMVNADEVIEWLECKAFQGWAEEINIKQIVDKFKKDFGL